MSFSDILDKNGKIDARYLPLNSGGVTGSTGSTPNLSQVLAIGTDNGNHNITNTSGAFLQMDGTLTKLKNPSTSSDAYISLDASGNINIKSQIGQRLNISNNITASGITPLYDVVIDNAGNVGVNILPQLETATINILTTTINLNYTRTAYNVFLEIEPFAYTNGGSAVPAIATTTFLPSNIRPARDVSFYIQFKYTDGGGATVEPDIATIKTDGTIIFTRGTTGNYAISAEIELLKGFSFSYSLV